MNAPIVIVQPADFATDERVAAFRSWARISTRQTGVTDLLKSHLRAAVREAEVVMCRALLRQTREQLHPPASGRDVLLTGEALHRLVEVAELDASGGEQAIAADELTLAAEHGRIYFDNWDGNAVWRRVRFECGWEDVDALPPDVLHRVYAMAAASWAGRPSTADAAREDLRARYRLQSAGWLTTGV